MTEQTPILTRKYVSLGQGGHPWGLTEIGLQRQVRVIILGSIAHTLSPFVT